MVLTAVVAVAVVVVVVVGSLGADVFHLEAVAALGAALERALAGHLFLRINTHPRRNSSNTYREPDDGVGVGRETGAAGVLLVTERTDNDRVVDRAWTMASTFSPCDWQFDITERQCSSRSKFPSNCRSLTQARSVQRLHVENIDTLDLSENLKTLKTGRLLKVGGDGAGGRARGQEVCLGVDLCIARRRTRN